MEVSEDSKELRENETRLFPSAHISGTHEAELRATAALLAMVRAVSEFGRSFVRLAGGPAGHIRCFSEPSFSLESPQGPRAIRPDGVILATRGRTTWKAFVEVKVGANPLEQSQFDDYHKLASQEGFDALITIGNQPALANSLPPLTIDRRRLRRVHVIHFSWERLLSEARVLCRRDEVEDSDQVWMLNEWIRYVADDQSRIIERPELGPCWHDILTAARHGHLESARPQLEDVVTHWDGFLRKSALRLRADLGVEVQRRESRADRQDPASRIARLTARALKSGRLSGQMRIPDAAGDLTVEVQLQARTAHFALEVVPPSEGRARTRVSWILRQLRRLPNAPGDMILRVDWEQRGLQSWASLGALLSDESRIFRDPQSILIPKGMLPRRFTLEWSTRLKKGRGRSTARVLDGVHSNVESFYENVVQGLVRFQPRAPQLQKGDSGADEQQSPEKRTASTAAPPSATATPVSETDVVRPDLAVSPSVSTGVVSDPGIETNLGRPVEAMPQEND